MKKFESEVSTGNMTGKAGVASIPFGRGYMQSGGNNGSCGIQFTPSSEPNIKTYKSMKHKKKRKMKKFEEFINEDCATMGNTGGMGAVVAAQPSSTPGDVAGSTTGSGDIGQAFGTYIKQPAKTSKRKKNKMKNLTSFKNFKP